MKEWTGLNIKRSMIAEHKYIERGRDFILTALHGMIQINFWMDLPGTNVSVILEQGAIDLMDEGGYRGRCASWEG